MSRWLAALAALVTAISPAPAAARMLAEIRQSGELRICVAGTSSAFYQSNAEAFAASLHVRPVVTRLASFDQQFQNAQGVTVKEATYEAHLLASGKCDLFPNDLHVTDWRRSKMLLVPYYTTRMVVVAHRDMRPRLKAAEDLAGHSAAVQKGTGYEAWLNGQNESAFKSNPVKIELLPTAEAMKRVSEGKADFSVIGAEGAFKWVRGELPNLDLLFPVDQLVEVGWGMSPGAQDLKQAVERFFVDNLRVGSELDTAWQKQYGISRMEYQLIESSFAQQGFDFKALRAWGIPLGSGLLGLLLAMIFWTWRLKREVRERERTSAALRESRDTLARESGRRQAQAEVILGLQRVTTERDFARALLSNLSRHLPIGQGILCRWDEGARRLRALAHYAGSGATPAESLGEFSTEGGLIDRCLATAAPVLVEQPGANYLRIRSGLGDCAPAAILLFPIRQLGRIRALLEIAMLKPFASEHRQLLEDLEPVIALSLERLPPEDEGYSGATALR